VASLVPTLWAERITAQVERSALLVNMFPRRKPTRREKIRGRMLAARYQLASWIAGYDVTDTDW
jgi:hypothetical protein